MKGFILLLKFMTRFPIPLEPEYDSKKLGNSMKFFPFIGIIIGVLLYIIYYYGRIIIPSPYILATILVLAEIIMTGGLHLDGLADTFDGIFSYRSKQKMLEIMKDSRVGTNGALALIIYFFLKVLLLAGLETSFPFHGMGIAVLMTPVIARANSVLNCSVGKYAKSVGMAKDFVKETTRQGATFAILSSTIFLFLVQGILFPKLNPIHLVNIVFVIHVLGIYFAKLMDRKIGGITGDTLGAILELSEILFLLGLYISFSF